MSPIRMSRIETSMRLGLAFNEACNRHDVAGMMALLSDDCIFESADPIPNGAVYSGKEKISQYWLDFFRESPQAHIKIEDIFGLGERCVMYWKFTQGDSDGEDGHIRGVDIFRVKDSAICEQLSYVKGKMGV